jgi:UDP-glucose 4-epimerase
MSGKGFSVAGIGHGYWDPRESSKWGIETWVFSDVHLPALNDLEGKTSKPYAIFHAAGSGSVPMSLRNPYIDFQRTVCTTLDVLEYVRLRSPETKLIYPSSAAVYGAVIKGKISEETPLNPVSPYGVHKKIAESLIGSYATSFGLPICVVRFFSLFGNGLMKQLLWDICCRLEENDREIVLHGTGDEIRDWIHIDDAAGLVGIAMEKASSSATPVNGGTGEGATVREIVHEIVDAFGINRIQIKFSGIIREGDPRFYQADISKALSWNWNPLWDWRDGIREYVRWFKKMRGLK